MQLRVKIARYQILGHTRDLRRGRLVSATPLQGWTRLGASGVVRVEAQKLRGGTRQEDVPSILVQEHNSMRRVFR